MDPDTVARGRQTLLDYFRLANKNNHSDREITAIWIYGGPGTGKSSLARSIAQQRYGGDYYFHPACDIKWWGSYSGQRCVILDDFRKGQIFKSQGFEYLLRVLDRYDLEVEVKGGFVQGIWDVCIITSANAPDVEFTYHKENGDVVEENLGQLIRRLTHIVELRVLDGVVNEIDHTERLKRLYPAAAEPLKRSTIFGIELRNEHVQHDSAGSILSMGPE